MTRPPATGRAAEGDHRYLAYFDPAPTAGLLAFAQIADWSDIPLLVVSRPESEPPSTAAASTSAVNYNVYLMRLSANPSVAWGCVRATLVTDFDGLRSSSTAAMALLSGLPVIA